MPGAMSTRQKKRRDVSVPRKAFRYLHLLITVEWTPNTNCSKQKNGDNHATTEVAYKQHCGYKTPIWIFDAT
jgi:hypothetical protein